MRKQFKKYEKEERKLSANVLRYTFFETSIGKVFLALAEGKICELMFLDTMNNEEVLQVMTKRWPEIQLVEDLSLQNVWKKKVLETFSSEIIDDLFLRGTPFQVKVWQALLNIPAGQTRSYEQIAKAIGKPKAVRAVGSAIGKNAIAYFVPCHRVIRKDGSLGGYRWGTAIKKKLLALEKSL